MDDLNSAHALFGRMFESLLILMSAHEYRFVFPIAQTPSVSEN